MTTLAIVVIVWFIVSIAAAFFLGRFIKTCTTNEPTHPRTAEKIGPEQ